MASKKMTLLAGLMIPGMLFALAGCGTAGIQPMARTVKPLTQAKSKAPQPIAARSVTPAQAPVLSEDVRRAQYWNEDAKLVMAIHVTELNTTKISASANVFFSQEAVIQGKPCVFVARRYFSKAPVQFVEVPDYNKLAQKMQPLGEGDITKLYDAQAGLLLPEKAWSMAKTYQPPQGAAMSRFFLSTRAFLVKPAAGNASWNFFASGKKLLIDAVDKKVVGFESTPLNPNDRLNDGIWDVELQRASSVWLPTSPFQTSIHEEPAATN